MGACVSLNIMWLHAEQASFKMSPQQYQEKLDSVAALVNVLGQTDKVGRVGCWVARERYTCSIET
jgi:hypothetical protein